MPCNLKKKHFVGDDGIIAINIEIGKTKAATRTVPLPDVIGERLLAQISNKEGDDFVIGIGNKAVTERSRTSRHNMLLPIDSSFRHMYITAMERAGIEENVIAQIVGHERGKTMSYGYYSKGHELKKRKEAVDNSLEFLHP
ncbi:tyrosine-type recombinase/integrase [Alteromonas macleodii]|uniref:tyrosine-type recombinase/integrase n=1 Tax=Alteromonas TaxID=226 RepID=UPI001EF4F0C9|nr:tyrosine-type recombinase/integrase [Alteromonas sp. Cnat3-28]MCG7644550.1 tyrosine-type recombinase/integrase [Alteromonas sp. Cnat3-28]